MTAKFVVRLLDAEGALLSWTEVLAEAKPQGRPRSTPFHAIGPSTFVIERDGMATQLSVHWADLDVARVTPLMTPGPVQVGQVHRFDWIEPVWMVHGAGSIGTAGLEAYRQRLIAETKRWDWPCDELEGLEIAMTLVDAMLAEAAKGFDVPLPPVTLRGAVRVGVPVGGMGVVTTV